MPVLDRIHAFVYIFLFLYIFYYIAIDFCVSEINWEMRDFRVEAHLLK